MATKSKLISDIELRLTGGSPTDDTNVNRRQIGHLLDSFRDTLVEEELRRYKFDPKRIDYSILEQEQFTEYSEEDTEHNDEVLYYITLTNKPLDLDNDRGIVRVLGVDNQIINKMQVADLGVVDHLRWSKPSEDNLVYMPKGDIVYIKGLSTSLFTDYPITVYYVRSYIKSPIADTETFKIPDALLAPLLDEVENVLRRQHQIEVDEINDGLEE